MGQAEGRGRGREDAGPLGVWATQVCHRGAPEATDGWPGWHRRRVALAKAVSSWPLVLTGYPGPWFTREARQSC